MRKTNFIFKIVLLLTNMMTLNVAYISAFVLRWNGFDDTIYYTQQYDILLIYLNLVSIIISIRDRYFVEIEFINATKIFKLVLKDVITVILSLFLFIVALKGYQYSRQFHIIFAIVLFLITLIFRYLIFSFLLFYRLKKRKLKNVILLCLNEHLKLFFENFSNEKYADLHIRGVYTFDNDKVSYFNELSVLPFDYIIKNLTESTDEIIIFSSDIYQKQIDQTIEIAESKGIRARLVPNYSLLGGNLILEYDYNLPLLRVRPEPLEDINNYILKRTFDIVASTIFLIFIFPFIFIIITPIIKLSSAGPIFFKQKRTGQLNREFYCLKFRTMRVNIESDLLQARKGDPRLTRVGSILRKTNFDEFPQFINVLLGDMSIVGPRPHMLKHTKEYSEIIDKYKVRHFCKPGITGWAQVNGYRGETEDSYLMKKRVECDIWYIENWSFWLDIKIIFFTVYKMLRGDKKAY